MKHILNTIAVVSIAIVWVIFLVVVGKIDLPKYERSVNQNITETVGQPELVVEKEVKKEIPKVQKALSAPVIVTPPPEHASFDTFEVIAETNSERTKQGLVPLMFNQKLGTVAQKKLADIFDHQYFAHVSPNGVSVENLANNIGYSYAVIGENLAIGKWREVRELTHTWMASPSHRANILKPEYREIGVALGRGIYQGEEVWIAVQSFGAPLK